jgi:hypothetical protein
MSKSLRTLLAVAAFAAPLSFVGCEEPKKETPKVEAPKTEAPKAAEAKK